MGNHRSCNSDYATGWIVRGSNLVRGKVFFSLLECVETCLGASGKAARGVKLTLHLRLVPTLIMSGDIPPLLPYTFMSWTWKTLFYLHKFWASLKDHIVLLVSKKLRPTCARLRELFISFGFSCPASIGTDRFDSHGGPINWISPLFWKFARIKIVRWSWKRQTLGIDF